MEWTIRVNERCLEQSIGPLSACLLVLLASCMYHKHKSGLVVLRGVELIKERNKKKDIMYGAMQGY